MRRNLFFLFAFLGFIAPALGADPLTDPASSELRQCTAECRHSSKDAAAQEACDIKCVKEDQARQQQNAGSATDQKRQPSH